MTVAEKYLGIKTVCLTKIKKEGKKLFYENDGKLIPINRIYNRVIFDELDKIEGLETIPESQPGLPASKEAILNAPPL